MTSTNSSTALSMISPPSISPRLAGLRTLNISRENPNLELCSNNSIFRSSRDCSGRGEGGVSVPSASSSSPAKGLGLGLGLPDLGQKKRKGKQHQRAPPAGSQAASEALEALRRQTREAVRGLESTAAAAGPQTSGGNAEGMVEDFVKQFEELAGSQDMESIVETMMHQLLSKEILFEPMKEIGERYPKWLEEHKSELKKDEYDRYYQQYELIMKLNEVYEHDPENFPKIVELMQKMQECGQPPSDIVQELAPDLDLSQLGGQLTPEMLGSPSNCCIM